MPIRDSCFPSQPLLGILAVVCLNACDDCVWLRVSCKRQKAALCYCTKPSSSGQLAIDDSLQALRTACTWHQHAQDSFTVSKWQCCKFCKGCSSRCLTLLFAHLTVHVTAHLAVHTPAPTHFDMTAQMTEHQPGCISGCTCNSTHEHADCLMQALRPGVQGGQDGSFRATFEDKPLMSDIVFLRAWIGVDLPRFYNPVTNLLGPAVKPLPRQLKPGHLAPEVRQILHGVLSDHLLHTKAAACCKMHMREVDPAAIL